MNESELNLSFPHWSAIAEPVYSAKLQPELQPPENLFDIGSYKRFNDLGRKLAFRVRLLAAAKAWISEEDQEGDERLILADLLESLLEQIDDRGALMLERVVDPAIFQELVTRYDSMMSIKGNSTFLHNFVDVRSQPDLLLDDSVNASFLHPLFVLLIAMRVGGAVRLVDVRAKDAEPISVLAQDNMLHIDNTPFNDEYKVLLTWERGTTRGPNGQNFTYLPGTHKLARQCVVDGRGVWSSENCSIFTTPESVKSALAAQAKMSGRPDHEIVEVTGSEYPVSTVFPAGSLVHHRFRTSAGQSRSCIIAAFHRVADNPGSLVSEDAVPDSGLSSLLVGTSTIDDDAFIRALAAEKQRIVDLLRRLTLKQSRELSSAQVAMPPERFPQWFAAVTTAPSVSELRAASIGVVNRASASLDLRNSLRDRMMFDKHGPIDMVLYADNHEEVRKWARNSLRELPVGAVSEIVDTHIGGVRSLDISDVLSTASIAHILEQVASLLKQLSVNELHVELLNHIPTASVVEPEVIRDSLSQFALDLSQAIGRVDSRECLVSTSLFAFLVAECIVTAAPRVASSVPIDDLWRHYATLALAS